MLKTTLILAAIIAAVGFVLGDRPLLVQQLQVVSSDANARFLELGFNKSVAIDLPRDVREVLVADPKRSLSSCERCDKFTSPGRSWVIPTSFSTMTVADRLLR